MNEKIVKAIEIAFIKHDGQFRKGTRIPYIIHPLGVMNILLREQADDPSISDELVIAGVLHDIYEDTEMSLRRIKELFGLQVMKYVENASEPEELKKNRKGLDAWQTAKEHTIQQIKKLDRYSKILICADKYHNVRCMREDYYFIGDELWGRFRAPKELTKWYYESCFIAFSEGNSIVDTKVYKYLKEEVKILFGNGGGKLN